MTTFLAWVSVIAVVMWIGSKLSGPRWPRVRSRGDRDYRDW